MTQLNILYMTSISINRRNLFVSENSSDFGTATHWILCQIYKSYLSCQNSLMKLNTYLLPSSFMDFNDSSRILLNLTSFVLLRPLIAWLDLSQVMVLSRCHVVCRCLIKSSALKFIGWWLLKTFESEVSWLSYYPCNSRILFHISSSCS